MPLTWIEINQKNLVHNIREFQKIAPNSQIWPVIKSNAYGHGFAEVAEILDKENLVSGFAVVSLDEAMSLSLLTAKDIMVLSYFDFDQSQLEQVALKKISLPIYDLETADALDKVGESLKVKFLINIKIDSGTSRLGFLMTEADEAIKIISQKNNLIINTLYTHFAESEAEEQEFTKKQLGDFLNLCAKWPQFKKHSACSAATLSQSDSHGDLIRLGLSLYGLSPSPASRRRAWQNQMCLQPVLTWKTKIIQIKKLSAGTSVGYNRTYVTDKDCLLAILPIGYNEGYDRGFSNKAEVLINGYRCKVRGNICMNLTMVELVDGCEAKVNDEVVLLGQSEASYISADELALWANTINYEIVTRINPNIKRVIV